MQAQSTLNKVFQNLLAYTNQLNLERDTENFLEIVSLLMKRPMLKLGTPGTNKSGSAKTIFSCFTDAKVYRVGLTAESTSDDVFGGLIVDEFLKGNRVYNLEEGAAEHHFIIFDEIFKVENAGLLNKLLFFFDEASEIFQNGKMRPTKFEGGILTSNELPLPGTHDALMNRITIKAQVNRLQRGSNRKKMLGLKNQNITAPSLEIADLFAARSEALKVTISESILNILICDEEYERLCQIAIGQGMAIPAIEESRALVDQLFVQGVEVSDRQIVQLFGQGVTAPSFLQAVAWLTGSHEVTEDHFVYLLNALWRNEQEIPKVEKAIAKLDTASQYNERLDQFKELMINFKNLPESDPREKEKKRSAGLSLYANIESFMESISRDNSSPSGKVLSVLGELSTMRDTTELIFNQLKPSR